MKKWEYLVIKKQIRGFMVKEISPESDLNKFGNEGWELVDFNTSVNEAIFIFKREIKS